MRKVMKRKILLVIAAVLVLSLSVGFTSAYFSARDVAQGQAKLKLGGQTEITEEWPNDNKSVKIENIGETEVIVRVSIHGPNGMTVEPEGNWSEKQSDGFYYYKKILPVGKMTEPGDLLVKVVGVSDLAGDDFDIVVTHESLQPTYDENNKVVNPDGWNLPDDFASEEGGVERQ